MKKILDTGNAACALAVKAAKVDMVAAYPITPQTSVAEKLAAYIGSGELQAKYLPVESEHSVMSAVGRRHAEPGFTATPSRALHEIFTRWGTSLHCHGHVNRAVAPGAYM